MYPELFTIPLLNLPVHTYGAFYVMALIVGIFAAYRQASLGNRYQEDVLDVGFWALLGALVGARILFILVEWNYYFSEHPYTYIPALGFSIPTVLAVWKGGFVFWGGVLGATAFVIIFCRKRKIDPWAFGDLAIVGLPIGHAIGRLGCVAGGCCYGQLDYHLDKAGNIVANSPFSLVYPQKSSPFYVWYEKGDVAIQSYMEHYHTTVPLFPVQILESFLNLSIFLLLIFLTPLKRAHGQILLLYFVFYSVMRSITELFRGDSVRGFVIDGVLSTSQFISLITSIVALSLMVFLSKRKGSNEKLG